MLFSPNGSFTAPVRHDLCSLLNIHRITSHLHLEQQDTGYMIIILTIGWTNPLRVQRDASQMPSEINFKGAVVTVTESVRRCEQTNAD